MEICHVFQFVRPGAPERGQLLSKGLSAGAERRHPGQGTANVCFYFDNAYLELLWAEDEGELTSGSVSPTGLWQRSRWRETDACPFGIALRLAPDSPVSFGNWLYNAPYLPPGSAIPVAEESRDPAHPLIFVSPAASRPDQWRDGRAAKRQTGSEHAELRVSRIVYPAHVEPGAAMRDLEARGLVQVGSSRGTGYRIIIETVGADGQVDGTLVLPL